MDSSIGGRAVLRLAGHISKSGTAVLTVQFQDEPAAVYTVWREAGSPQWRVRPHLTQGGHVSTLRSAMRCTGCGGSLLPHARAGAPRGSCHCWRGSGRVSGTRQDGDVRNGLARYEFTVYYPGWDDEVATFADFASAFELLNQKRLTDFRAHGIQSWPILNITKEQFNVRYQHVVNRR